MEIRTITGKVRHSLVSAAQYYGRSVIRESLIIRIVTRRRRSPYSQKSKPIKRKNWSSQSFVRGSTLLVKLEVLKEPAKDKTPPIVTGKQIGRAHV